MSKRLVDNISSDYFNAANHLTSRKQRRRIVAYVESYDDIYFWRTVLSRFETPQHYFEVMLPARVEHLERGKKAVLASLMNRAGSDMIACVDADYDYLIQGATPTSKQVVENPWVLHTYVYAIENYQCYAPSLHDVCVAVTLNDHTVFDFQRFLTSFSRIVYPLFVWNIWYYRTPHYGDFTITQFLHVIEMGHINPFNPAPALSALEHKVQRKVEQLWRTNRNARNSYEQLKKELARLGVVPDKTYLYIQGHHLFDKIVLPIMQRVCDKLVREREVEISRQSMHSTQRNNELACYRGSLEDITGMLKKNSGFFGSEPYRRLLADVERIMPSEKENTTQAQ